MLHVSYNSLLIPWKMYNPSSVMINRSENLHVYALMCLTQHISMHKELQTGARINWNKFLWLVNNSLRVGDITLAINFPLQLRRLKGKACIISIPVISPTDVALSRNPHPARRDLGLEIFRLIGPTSAPNGDKCCTPSCSSRYLLLLLIVYVCLFLCRARACLALCSVFVYWYLMYEVNLEIV